MTAAELLNAADAATARRLLEKCCAAERWIEGMLVRRPFADDGRLHEAAAEAWWSLGPDDWREAFAAHPRIGDVDSLRVRYAGTRGWSEREQSGVAGASEETLARLAAGNADYERKFGYIFIVCATGKSADEMLTILESRLPHDPAEEIHIAAAEQLKITQLRLEKLES